VENVPPGVNTDSDVPSSIVTMHSELKPVSDNLEGALTYNPDLAPVNAMMKVESHTENDGTMVALEVEGFLPNRGYAIHAHTEHCGPTGDDARPHYQHIVDPQATRDNPSRGPEYANPQNEIWLDLVTDDNGNATTGRIACLTVPFSS
jgi:Cu-Zn family superoxide dismutase